MKLAARRVADAGAPEPEARRARVRSRSGATRSCRPRADEKPLQRAVDRRRCAPPRRRRVAARRRGGRSEARGAAPTARRAAAEASRASRPTSTRSPRAACASPTRSRRRRGPARARVAMLAGERSTKLGVDPLPWILPAAHGCGVLPLRPAAAAAPPSRERRRDARVREQLLHGRLRPRRRRHGVRARLRPPLSNARHGEITRDAVDWLDATRRERFFLFCNYNSPHEPLEPPSASSTRSPPRRPVGRATTWCARTWRRPRRTTRPSASSWSKLDDLGLAGATLVVVTADHGETLSSAHDGISALDRMPMRFHHAVGNYEETTRIPHRDGACPASSPRATRSKPRCATWTSRRRCSRSSGGTGPRE